ncbi:ubiquitin carboxyl-terminal hydrolase [Emydomyces testavorans]|uniref:Ubiquitin carboxyl-terminal hydrolase n=1 Tax=Emydomyces testavorans TaxID=2070801 RepID=A0AAF0DCQ6_9EURO|nr:ubiquitin carboxyl-terminal hydrolase [Emydomyces testavorans]
MPEKPATIAAYAAGASLAAITLFYVFGPNFTLDGDESNISGRKKGIVGLSNPANDCFINSVLQALAGLGELRLYLIRELYRRELEGKEIYESVPDAEDVPRGRSPEGVRQLQLAPVTKALKEMLDKLNERPIYRKTISARGFIQALEHAFRTRISRNQQDAHEFLQVVAERLCDEYHAGVKARKRAGAFLTVPVGGPGTLKAVDVESEKVPGTIPNVADVDSEDALMAGSRLKEATREDYGFPLEGMLESQVECQFCGYKYKPNQTSFVNLTLQVPQKSSTTLSACFDGLLKTEYIEDFRCDNCQLIYTLDVKTKALQRASSDPERKAVENEISLLKYAIDHDPEVPLEGVEMPDARSIPRRKIARHMRITEFPSVLAIHLSRSIFDQSASTKNAAKVSFPERLPLGGILIRRWYRLLGIVCHKGSHHSGHYESFRQNHVYAPFSTPDAFRSYAQSRSASENPSAMSSPKMHIVPKPSDAEMSTLTISTESDISSSSISSASLPTVSPSLAQRSPLTSTFADRPTSATSLNRIPPRSSPLPAVSTKLDTGTKGSGRPSSSDPSLFRRKKRQNERWWRISDDRVKECKTSDVLGMQREVYLLFYEMERPGNEPSTT